MEFPEFNNEIKKQTESITIPIVVPSQPEYDQIQKDYKNNMICFAADMVYKALNPDSTMCTPNALYIKIESELEKWEK